MDQPQKGFSQSLEQQLVLASISLDQGKDERIREICKHGLDWQLLRRITLQQGIFPLFYHRLKAVAEKQIPPEQIVLLDQCYQDNSQKSYRLAWKLIQFADLLSDNKVECVILKGPVFALMAFGDLALRQFLDLDLLIHAQDFSKVYALLCQFGYSPTFELKPTQLKFEVQSDYHFAFIRQGDIFEVHWEVAPKGYLYPLTTEQMWQGLNSISGLEREIYSLSPENTIFYTCLHGAKHSWRQLKWIVDLAYLSQSYPDIDWRALLDQARYQGLYRQVCLGLLLAEVLCGATIPSKVGDLIHADRSAQLLAAQVRGRLLAEHNRSGLIADYGFYLQSRERWRDRLYNLFDMAFVPKQVDWLTFSLPEPFYPFYYLFRPLRLSAKMSRAAFSALFK